ncbi:hypothetical protein HYC85_014026 [Camellia sinensis]|uniref:Peptidase M24 domain-containing protein n=1 Tax=Camellia sinensis TaxID=4442 RepID=A0A7J7H598_CAMSI|nr:hypothetical protein HYC85_014026 [Camellia sinensis]
MYKNVKKKIERGVAFPTCVSVNNTLCHFSPLASDEAVLEEAHTHVLQRGPVTGSQADVIAAANTAAEVSLRLLRPGRKDLAWSLLWVWQLLFFFTKLPSLQQK